MDECKKRAEIHRKVKSYLMSYSCSLWERLSLCPKTIFTSENKPGDTIQLTKRRIAYGNKCTNEARMEDYDDTLL